LGTGTGTFCTGTISGTQYSTNCSWWPVDDKTPAVDRSEGIQQHHHRTIC
jgi:hypothetical protein